MKLRRTRLSAFLMSLPAVFTTAALVVSPVILGTRVAEAYTVPFTDQNAVGSVTLCSKNGQSVTSGSLIDAPFVWMSVSSAAAPRGYNHATLYAFQPRRGVDPTDWAGYQLTYSSLFNDPTHPTVQATPRDSPLVFATGSYPPQWDGLIQLRMILSGTDRGAYPGPYATTVIRVAGNNWSLVSSGPTSPCSSGHATSDYYSALPASQVNTPQSVQLGSHPSTVPAPSGRSANPAFGADSRGTSGARQSHQEAPGAAAASGSTRHSSGNIGLIVGPIAAAILVSGAGAWWYRRHRRLTSPASASHL